jgi:glycolate oxidase iron-sulfur subunit
VDAWTAWLDNGVEGIVMTASGCGVTVKEYGRLLKHDPVYAEKAARISAAAKDIAEVILAEKSQLERQLKEMGDPAHNRPAVKLAFHSPCTLQHGQKINGAVEAMLTMSGYQLTEAPDGHLCCGSAGTYSILQREISQRLLSGKVVALESGKPEMIATANIGCLMHLQSGTKLSVKHWIELLDERLGNLLARKPPSRPAGLVQRL